MRVQTFVGKVSVEGLAKMDELINAWLGRNNVDIRFVCQSFGSEVHHDVTSQEPVVVTTVWFEQG